MPDEQIKYFLGAKKDKPDRRDYPLTRMTAKLAAQLPPSIDYTDKMSPISNQLNEGTCVGFATVDGMKEYQEKVELVKDIQLSPRYVYEHAREIDEFLDDEEGTSVRAAMKVLLDKGVCYESCWPYIPQRKGSPCPDADEQAKAFKIERYVRMETVQEMRESLVTNGPFVMSIVVFNGIFDAPGGVVPMPGADEDYIGGHAICIVGYDDTKALLKFRNSWGVLWGDKGYGYLPYEYIDDYMMDSWSAKDSLYNPTPPQPSWWERIIRWLKVLFGWK
jgi:C1A family cysteine protease